LAEAKREYNFKVISVSIDPSVFEIIEKERGLISRSAYVNHLLKKALLPILKTDAQHAGG
jgi:hypothetical protein